ncbi:hypothetical protein AZE42_04897 [Rhizopogon vesiculosus]|uniref:Uncharacterized protein n=1 Tax=Rhizopogon vesiculosus TaxID=180088 RepID=A0A1J8R3U9_9AGAM|nr:hypothetical protein AZE42_04897 [Rhizopogon vesiculosus]
MSTKFVQSVPQDIVIKADSAPKYAFLAYPPPAKKRPTQPLPSPPSNAKQPVSQAAPTRRRSNTFSTIAAWAAHVQPGSPASLSPRSPRRRPSFGRGRRPSITCTRVASGSFLNIIDTPSIACCGAATPLVQNFKADLTSVGYTSVFLQLPNTPVTATLPIALKSQTGKQIPVPPVPASPTRKPRGLSRFRSLSVLKSRGRSRSAAPSPPTKMKPKAAASSAAVVKRKKAKYAALRPPPLANELALMQFVDGGSMESNIKRVMEAQAKAGAAGVADVYRDGEGGIWWDQEEEWEYAHLLAGGEDGAAHGMGDLQWVTFGKSPSGNVVDDDERRGSVSTQDSDLDPRYIVQPTDHLDTDDLAVFGSTLAPLTTRKPAMSVLAIPSRPHRAAKHLHKPDFLLNIAFTRGSMSPKSPRFTTSTFASGIAKPKGKARRRPAPLTLSPPSPALKQPSNSPVDAEQIRKDFLDSSFEPAVPATPATTPGVQNNRAKLTTRTLNLPFQSTNGSSLSLPSKKTLAKKPSRLNMMSLFKSSKKEAECTVH